jgi:hypothetical protein
MSATNIETILASLATALENYIPDVRPNVRFRRWKGADRVENAPLPMRERAFQLRLGISRIPRTLSALDSFWCRAELQLIVGYNFSEPRQNDVAGIGIDAMAWADQKAVLAALMFGRPLANVPHCKSLIFNAADAPSTSARTYRFDLEWAEQT